MIVEFEWVEQNRYKAKVAVNEDQVRADGYDPDSPADVLSWLQENENTWAENVDDWGTALTAVEERQVVRVHEIDPKSGVLT